MAQGVDAGREFVTAKFSVWKRLKKLQRRIVGKDFVYVAALVKKLNSFIPEFDVVKNDAIAKATAKATREALLKKAEELKKAAEAGNFKKVIADAGAKTTTTQEFSLQNPLQENPNANTLLGAALELKTGEISEPLPALNRVLILAEMTNRKAADEANIEGTRETLVSAVENQQMQAIIASWQNAILTEADFEDLTPEGE